MVRASRWLNLLLVALLLFGSAPTKLSSAPIALASSEASLEASPAELVEQTRSGPVEAALPRAELSRQLFLPLVRQSVPPLDSASRILLPEVGGKIELLDARIVATFSPAAIRQATRVDLAAQPAPAITQPGVGAGGPAIQIALSLDRDGSAVPSLPSLVSPVPASALAPAGSVVTPSITLALRYTEADVWGLDPRTLGLYSRSDAGEVWQRVPSAVYPEQRLIVAHIEQPGEYVPLGRLSLHSAALASAARIALDPDDDDGGALWPGRGTLRELTYNLLLAEAVRDRLVRDGCVADAPLITRGATRFVDNNLRVDAIQGYGADVAATVAFNTLRGVPWGVPGDGGPVTYARTTDDRALAQSLLSEILNYTTRRTTRPILPHTALPPEYRAFDRLAGTHAHLETLFLDHNYDFPIIDTGFDKVADGVYVGIRRHLESRGFTCLVDPGDGSGPRPPPYPARPSDEQIQRWRDLGYQNYQRYGGDPVSFSTGNHILQLALGRLPGRGGLDIDLTLTYNAQDQRSDLLGHG